LNNRFAETQIDPAWQEPCPPDSIGTVFTTGQRQFGRQAMKKLLITTAILACAASAFAAETPKTVGQAPPGASTYYLAQDTASMKCEVIGTRPASGSKLKVIGPAHATQAEAETAMMADKSCAK
jgi:hypothetical protein